MDQVGEIMMISMFFLISFFEMGVLKCKLERRNLFERYLFKSLHPLREGVHKTIESVIMIIPRVGGVCGSVMTPP